jgi:hypothetical protein
MRLRLCFLFVLGALGACVSQRLPNHGTGGGGGDPMGTTGSGASGSGGSIAGGGSGGGSGGCAGAAVCPAAGCTFAKAVANCAVDYADSDTVGYTTKPCAGYDVIYETQDPDTENAYFFDHSSGKLVASIDYEDAGYIETCSGPTDFVVPTSCDPPPSAALTDCPAGAGGGTSMSGSGGGVP